MTFLELQNLVAYWLDDLQFQYFTNTQVKRFINNGFREVQKLLIQADENVYLKCVKTTMVVNQPDYNLPSDFMKLERVGVVLDGTFPSETMQYLSPLTLMQQDFIGNKTGTPEFFYLKQNKIILMPAPDTAKVLRLDYSYRIADMASDSETPDCPQEYHEFGAVLAAIDGFNKDGRNPEPLIEKRNYYMKQLENDAESRIDSQPRMVVATGDDFGSLF